MYPPSPSSLVHTHVRIYIYATPGPYLRKTMLVRLAREVSDHFSARGSFMARQPLPMPMVGVCIPTSSLPIPPHPITTTKNRIHAVTSPQRRERPGDKHSSLLSPCAPRVVTRIPRRANKHHAPTQLPNLPLPTTGHKPISPTQRNTTSK